MATTIDGNSLNLPGGGEIANGAEIRAIRLSHTTNNTGNVNMTNQSEYDMGCEITMPPAVGSDSIYLLWGQCVFDDTNQATNGFGLCFWVDQDGQQEWIHRAGDHSTYDNAGGDRYRHGVATELDLPNNPSTGGGNFGASPNVSAGKVRKYRLYANAHNSNLNAKCGVGGQSNSRAQLVVVELSGGFIASGYGN